VHAFVFGENRPGKWNHVVFHVNGGLFYRLRGLIVTSFKVRTPLRSVSVEEHKSPLNLFGCSPLLLASFFYERKLLRSYTSLKFPVRRTIIFTASMHCRCFGFHQHTAIIIAVQLANGWRECPMSTSRHVRCHKPITEQYRRFQTLAPGIGARDCGVARVLAIIIDLMNDRRT
jgi:hypothetical protein